MVGLGAASGTGWTAGCARSAPASPRPRLACSRRSALPLIAFSPLAVGAGCGKAPLVLRKRFRVIATAEADGRRMEGSTVIEAAWAIHDPIPGGRIYRTLQGEAMILDLGARGAVFVLLQEHARNGNFQDVYHVAIIRLLGFDGFGLDQQRIEALRRFSGRHRLPPLGPGRGRVLPAFVAFRDEAVPRTVYKVDPDNLAASFGAGVRLVDFEIETTDAPVTDAVRKRLAWLDRNNELSGFDRDPPGKQRADIDLPIGYRLTYDSFVQRQ
jgi:hypothetical protein